MNQPVTVTPEYKGTTELNCTNKANNTSAPSTFPQSGQQKISPQMTPKMGGK